MATSDDSHQMIRTRLATQIALTAIVFAMAMTQAQSPSTAIRGTWQARVLTKNGATSRLLSGNWRTQIAAADLRTLQELLHKTLSYVVNGTWASGRLAGAWSLRAYP